MKKFLCLLLAAVLAGLLILPCAAAEPTDFTDRSTIRNYNAVRMLADLGLVAGYSDGSFGPDKLIRREDRQVQTADDRTWQENIQPGDGIQCTGKEIDDSFHMFSFPDAPRPSFSFS